LSGQSTSFLPAYLCRLAFWLVHQDPSRLAAAILEGLGLVDGEGAMRPLQSLFARRYLEILRAKPENQVTNRGELIEIVGSSPAGLLEKDIPFHLEPEWTAVILLALVHSGEIVLTVDRRDSLDASNLERAAVINIDDLANFRRYARTKGVPVERWARIFEAFGLSPGLIRDETQREDGVRRLQDAVGREAKRAADLKGRLSQNLQLWNKPLFTDRTLISEGGVVESTAIDPVVLLRNQFDPELRAYQTALEKLGRYNTTGKLRNLDLQFALFVAHAAAGRGEVELAATLLGAAVTWHTEMSVGQQFVDEPVVRNLEQAILDQIDEATLKRGFRRGAEIGLHAAATAALEAIARLKVAPDA
jgi:hypothetical protein